MASEVPIEVQQGETNEYNVTVRDSLGALVNIAGWVFSGELRSDFTSNGGALLATFVWSNNGGAAGTITATLTAAETRLINPFTYNLKGRYEMRGTDPGGKVKRVDFGEATLKPWTGT